MSKNKKSKIFEWVRDDSSRVMLYIEGIEKSEIENILSKLNEVLYKQNDLPEIFQ